MTTRLKEDFDGEFNHLSEIMNELLAEQDSLSDDATEEEKMKLTTHIWAITERVMKITKGD